jgi:hypothetical protein
VDEPYPAQFSVLTDRYPPFRLVPRADMSGAMGTSKARRRT